MIENLLEIIVCCYYEAIARVKFWWKFFYFGDLTTSLKWYVLAFGLLILWSVLWLLNVLGLKIELSLIKAMIWAFLLFGFLIILVWLCKPYKERYKKLYNFLVDYLVAIIGMYAVALLLFSTINKDNSFYSLLPYFVATCASIGLINSIFFTFSSTTRALIILTPITAWVTAYLLDASNLLSYQFLTKDIEFGYTLIEGAILFGFYIFLKITPLLFTLALFAIVFYFWMYPDFITSKDKIQESEHKKSGQYIGFGFFVAALLLFLTHYYFKDFSQKTIEQHVKKSIYNYEMRDSALCMGSIPKTPSRTYKILSLTDSIARLADKNHKTGEIIFSNIDCKLALSATSTLINLNPVSSNNKSKKK